MRVKYVSRLYTGNQFPSRCETPGSKNITQIKEKKFRHICPCDVINGKDSSRDDRFSGKGCAAAS